MKHIIRSLRIFNLITTLGAGGAERQLSYIMPELAYLGHDVHITFLKNGIYSKYLENSGVTLHQLSARSNYDPHIFFQIYKLVNKLNPDIIQTWNFQTDILGGIIAKINKIIHVIREPSSELLYSISKKNLIRQSVGSHASAIISNSRGGDLYWEALKTRGQRYIIPNALALEEINKSSDNPLPRFNIAENQKYILYVGRIDILKNTLTLFYSLLPVLDHLPIIALFCGDGTQRTNLENLIERFAMSSKIFLLGIVSDVWALMKRAELLISVSHVEGRPNAVIEAMACGCPLVVSDIPAHREFLDEESAIFVDKDDPSCIAKGIMNVLSTPEQAKKRAEKAMLRTGEWSIPKIAKQYENIYMNLLDN